MNYYYLLFLPILVYIIRKIFNGPATKLSADMTNKLVVITGSSAGIGKETAKNLLLKGATVIFANRDLNKTNRIIQNILKRYPQIPKENAVFIKLELSSLASVSEFSKTIHLKYPKIDILINNAGITNETFIKTEDGIEAVFQVNHLSHTILSGLLIDLLKKSDDGRIINVSSDAHRFTNYSENYFQFTESTYEVWNSYCVSKLANLFLTYKLRDYFESRKLNVKSVCLHPGAVYTEISRPADKSFKYKLFIYLIFLPIMLLFFRDEEIGAQTTLHCCYLSKEQLVDGGYYASNRLTNPSWKASDPKFKHKINSVAYNTIINSNVYKENLKNVDFKEFVDTFII